MKELIINERHLAWARLARRVLAVCSESWTGLYMGLINRIFLTILLGVLATAASAQPTPMPNVTDRAPILIENVRPWDIETPDGGTVNVLIRDGVIQQVSSNSIEPPGEAIDVDGEGRFIVGRLVVGVPANIVVMEDNPSADITLLTDPDAIFLVVRNGEIESGELGDKLIARKTPTFRAVDPSLLNCIEY